ncbi:MAG TPA: trypsin-like peptidase domain-containing protein [Parasegetibacter sp.]
MQTEIQEVINKAYQTTLKIVGYDSTRKVVTGGQFSGVVVSEDGYILTAAHATMPGRVYLAMFPDGKEFVAVGLGRISSVDAALMKIVQPGTWPYAEMGWSYSLKPFQPCISISSPASLNRKREPVVRFGYVAEPVTRNGMIRTTCLMEPGDSGGPVFDMKGRVIGIHSRIDIALENNYEVAIDNFRKYWTALNLPESYGRDAVLREDKIGEDPLKDEFARYETLADLRVYFGEQEDELDQSVFTLNSKLDGDTSVALATLISTDGFTIGKDKKGAGLLISKSSLVGQDPEILLDNNRRVSATIVSRDDKLDLVLLKVNRKMKNGVSLFSQVIDSVDFSMVGKFLLSPHPHDEGEVSVIGSSLFDLAPRANMAFLGVTTEPSDTGVVLRNVSPNTAASFARLQVGDIIIKVNEKLIKSPEDLTEELIRYRPKDTVVLYGIRGDSPYMTQVVLGKRPQQNTHAADRFTDGKSDRRDGFQKIFMHDGKLKPSECGGPVFDVHGNFYGINIARFSRTSSIAIPASEVRKFVEMALK